MVASAALISLGLKKEEPSWQGEMCALCPKLTYQQRMYGFIGCSGLGYLLSFLSTLFLFGGFVGVWYGASFIPFGRKTIIKCCVFWGPCTSASCKPVERYLV